MARFAAMTGVWALVLGCSGLSPPKPIGDAGAGDAGLTRVDAGALDSGVLIDGGAASCDGRTCSGCCQGTACITTAEYSDMQCGGAAPGEACERCDDGCLFDAGVCAKGPGGVDLSYRFPDGGSCASAISGEAITTVEIVIDDQSPSVQGCQSSALSARNLAPGTHTFELRARGPSTFQYFRGATSVVVRPARVSSATVDLSYVVGGLPVKWRFTNNAVTQTCMSIGNPDVYVNLKDSNGSFVYSAAGVALPCKNADQVQGATFPYLTAGEYEVFVQAIGTGNQLYRSDQVTPPRVHIEAGRFPPLDGGVLINAAYP